MNPLSRSNNREQPVSRYFTYRTNSAEIECSAVPINSSKELQEVVATSQYRLRACSQCRISHTRCDHKDTNLKCKKAFQAYIDVQKAKPYRIHKQTIPGTGCIRSKGTSRSKSALPTRSIPSQTIFGPLTIRGLLNEAETTPLENPPISFMNLARKKQEFLA